MLLLGASTFLLDVLRSIFAIFFYRYLYLRDFTLRIFGHPGHAFALNEFGPLAPFQALSLRSRVQLSPAKEREATLGAANHNLEPNGWTPRAGCGGRNISEGA